MNFGGVWSVAPKKRVTVRRGAKKTLLRELAEKVQTQAHLFGLLYVEDKDEQKSE
jgi:hypothetical protein